MQASARAIDYSAGLFLEQAQRTKEQVIWISGFRYCPVSLTSCMSREEVSFVVWLEIKLLEFPSMWEMIRWQVPYSRYEIPFNVAVTLIVSLKGAGR